MTPVLRPVTEPHVWDANLSTLPLPHLLQCWQWGEFKARYGWSAQRLVWERGGQPVAAAQVLKRSLGPFCILYAPRGPLLDWADGDLAAAVLADLESLARRERAIFIKIDPEINLSARYSVINTHHPDRLFKIPSGFGLSGSQVQFRNTVWLDLARPESDLLASFKQKTRYNIRLAERKGVTVQAPAPGDAPLDTLYRLYAETSVRDGFVIRNAAYYADAWGSFMRAGRAQAFVAEVEGQPVAAIIVFHYAGRALYMYGMSSGQHREKMPNYLLQWRAMQWAQEQGCTLYDFWGAPDVFDDSDPLFGVWRFKEGFNGTVVRTPGALDYAPSGFLYTLYTGVLPRALHLLRRRGHAATRRALAD